MRPDVVIRNPHHGIIVFEVKDWLLDRYRFEGTNLIARTASESWVEHNPVMTARYYARSLYEQFLVSDEAGLDADIQPNNLALCRASVYFHNSNTERARNLFAVHGSPEMVLGRDHLVPCRLEEIVPLCNRRSSNFLREGQVDALERAHDWLVPPNHALEQMQQSRLTAGQAAYATPESGFRRIRGVAGAGKSFVLAHRAGSANQNGRNVLLLSFNITMSHVLRDMLKRVPYEVDWESVTWNHFHGWAQKQLIEAGLDSNGERNSDKQPGMFGVPSAQFDRLIGEKLEQLLRNERVARSYSKPLYDGIYIDEGQDFRPDWLDSLAGFLSEKGELVIFADHRQNVYARDGGRDVGQMSRCRFHGPWAQLPQQSHRIPWRVAMFLNVFAELLDHGDGEDRQIQDYAERQIQGDLALDVMGWRNVDSFNEGIDALDDALANFGKPNPGDVVILVATHDLGLRAVQRLKPKYRQIVHVFANNDEESRRRKHAFWMGRGGLKMCTIQSFKGWEIDNVILLWPEETDIGGEIEEHRALLYTAISRAMRNVIVINADRRFDGFAAHWDEVPFEG
jgi:superfamily I DNA/RNA helicase